MSFADQKSYGNKFSCMAKPDTFNECCRYEYYTITSHLRPKTYFGTPDEIEKYVRDYELWVKDVVGLYEEFKRDYEANKETLVREVEEYNKMMNEMR